MERIPASAFKSDFLPSYPMPPEQKEQEKEFRQHMTDFPDMDEAVNFNLDNLLADNNVGRTKLVLSNTEWVRREVQKYDGDENLPLETSAMVHGLYALTGSHVKREETVDAGGGDFSHRTTRFGKYNGKDVCFLETIVMVADGNGAYHKREIRLTALDPEEAKREINRPFQHEWSEFETIVGRPIDRDEVRGVTRSNYRQMAEQIAAAEAAKGVPTDGNDTLHRDVTELLGSVASGEVETPIPQPPNKGGAIKNIASIFKSLRNHL